MQERHSILTANPPSASGQRRLRESWYDDVDTAESVLQLYEKLEPVVPGDRGARGKLLQQILTDSGLTIRRYAEATGYARFSVWQKIHARRNIATVEIAEALLLAERVQSLFTGTKHRRHALLRVRDHLRLTHKATPLTDTAKNRISDTENSTDAAKNIILADLIAQTTLTDADFGALLGFHHSVISKMLLGRYPIRPEVLQRAAKLSEEAIWALRPLRADPRSD